MRLSGVLLMLILCFSYMLETMNYIYIGIHFCCADSCCCYFDLFSGNSSNFPQITRPTTLLVLCKLQKQKYNCQILETLITFL